MTFGTASGCDLWVGDRWFDDTGTEGLVRITIVDPYLGLVEAQGEDGMTTSATIDVFRATHHQLGRSALAAEHGWR